MAYLLDPSMLIVGAAVLAFVVVVATAVAVLRWMLIRRNPDIKS